MFICNRQVEEYWANDDLSVLLGVGKMTKEKLNRYGIKTVEYLALVALDEVSSDLVTFVFKTELASRPYLCLVTLYKKQKLVVFQPTKRWTIESLQIHIC